MGIGYACMHIAHPATGNEHGYSQMRCWRLYFIYCRTRGERDNLAASLIWPPPPGRYLTEMINDTTHWAFVNVRNDAGKMSRLYPGPFCQKSIKRDFRL